MQYEETKQLLHAYLAENPMETEVTLFEFFPFILKREIEHSDRRNENADTSWENEMRERSEGEIEKDFFNALYPGKIFFTCLITVSLAFFRWLLLKY